MNHIRGFTLIELMIVIAIIAVLTAIAYPSYQNYIKRTNRVETQATMMEIAQKLQSYKLANGDYGKSNLNSGYATNPLKNPIIYGVTVSPRSGRAVYNLTITESPKSSWELVATPTDSSIQQGDGALTLTHNGTQCWYKGKDDGTGACITWTSR